jgi:hypothetical protein
MLGQHPIELVTGAQPARLREHDHRRKGDPETHQGDVHRERQRLHLPRLEKAAARLVGQRCWHLGITVDEMAAAMGAGR